MEPECTQRATRTGYSAASGMPARTPSANRRVGRAHALTFARSLRFLGVQHFLDATTDNQVVPAFDPAGIDRTSLHIRSSACGPDPVLSAGSRLPAAE